MKHLHIYSWRRLTNSGPQPLSHETLLERLEAAAEVTDMARARLVRRILARCAVAFPLRESIDPRTIISWLSNAGAVVALSTVAAISPSVPSPPHEF